MSGDHTRPVPSGELRFSSEAATVLVTALLEAETKERFAEILAGCGDVLQGLRLLERAMRLADQMETASNITQEQVRDAIPEMAAHPATQWVIEKLFS